MSSFGGGLGGGVKLRLVAACLPFAALSCSAADSAVLPSLSPNKSANVTVIAQLVDRACVQTVAKPDAYATMLSRTGWNYRQTQKADRKTTLDVWQMPHVTLVHSAVPIKAQTANVWTCSVEVDAVVAPAVPQMEALLRQGIASRDIFDSKPGDWHWKPSILSEAHITVGPGGMKPRNMMIFVEYAELKPINALFGS